MPNPNSIFLAKLLIFFVFALQSINCQADVKDLQNADSLFQQRSYKEAMEIYRQNYQEGIYSPAMLLKMSFIAEGIGDKENATLYLSKYYDLNPNSQTITKIKSLTGQSDLVGYEVSDAARFMLFLIEYQEIIVGSLALFLVISIIMIWVRGKKNPESTFYWPTIFLIILIFAANNFLKAPNAALITQSPTMIVSKPSAGGELIDRVEPGHRVKIKSSKDIWYEVEWKDQVAYIKKDNVTRF
ncbi:SH3 domain-containing protein [Algoriphagus machipongonensis]|uniref:SH3b domain-containing protein n=1 Tax=Algoriphagus machipongonensis TaxID=388413 RepID=A3HX27_9BACT|nr:SH3 domain-containing protein [Algoriphagus machipongonensis]EAZ81150.1 hypothetical protein ALPR1_18978 [Algoriphagus machipongonensis]